MVALTDLLSVAELDLAEAVVPRPRAEIRWVATSELVDPAPYLAGGEVLLTTGLETKGWRTQWRAYVERLVRADVAGLGLGIGLTHRRAPVALVAACRQAGLNLFEVPRPTPFVSVSQVFAGLLDEERDQVARRSLDAQRALTRAALARDDVRSLLAVLAEQVDGAAATVTRDGEPVDRAGELDTEAVRAEVRRIRDQGLRAAASTSGGAGTTVVQPLGVLPRPELWLAVSVPGRIGDVQRATVASAVSLLSLALDRRQDRRSAERRLRARALEQVLAGEPRTARILLDARLPRQVRVLVARGSTDAVEDSLGALERDGVLAAVVRDDLTVVCAVRRASATAALLAERDLLVGVGRSVPVDEAAESEATATSALASATSVAPVRRWEDQARGGVAGLLDPGRARAFAHSYLGPLDDPALIETLTAFLRRHGSVLATAEDLAVHRNTVRNRVRQIEALLGVSLEDPQVRVDAWVALQAR